MSSVSSRIPPTARPPASAATESVMVASERIALLIDPIGPNQTPPVARPGVFFLTLFRPRETLSAAVGRSSEPVGNRGFCPWADGDAPPRHAVRSDHTPFPHLRTTGCRGPFHGSQTVFRPEDRLEITGKRHVSDMVPTVPLTRHERVNHRFLAVLPISPPPDGTFVQGLPKASFLIVILLFLFPLLPFFHPRRRRKRGWMGEAAGWGSAGVSVAPGSGTVGVFRGRVPGPRRGSSEGVRHESAMCA